MGVDADSQIREPASRQSIFASWRDLLMREPGRVFSVLLGISFAGMLILCTMENHSRVGRIIFSGAALVIIAAGVLLRWYAAQHLRRFILPVGAVAAATLISCFYSIAPSFSFGNFFEQHLWFFLLFLAVGAWATTPARQRFFLRGLMAGALFSAVAGVVLYFFAEPLHEYGLVGKVTDFVYTAQDVSGNEYRRARGLLLSYTRSALFLTIAIPGVIVLAREAFRHGRREEFTIALLTLVVSAFYLLLTKSRGAWVAAGVASLLVCLLLRMRIRTIIVGVVVAMIAVAVLPSERARALTLIKHLSNPDLFLSGRLELWEQARAPIVEVPWTGIGYGGNIFLTEEAEEAGFALRSADTRQPDLHQLYLQTLAEVGILGIAAYGWLILCLVAAGIGIVRSPVLSRHFPGAIAAFSVLVAMLLIGAVYYMNEENVAQALYATLGLIAGAQRRPALEAIAQKE